MTRHSWTGTVALALAVSILAATLTACVAQNGRAYPRDVHEVPPAFQGRWDEIVEDGCSDRESRFSLEARSMHNFEVLYHVRKVTVLSPVEIEVHARLDPMFGDVEDAVWMFKLVEGGKALAAPDGRPPFYEQCPPFE